MNNCVISVSVLLLCAGLGAGQPISENEIPPVAVWPADLEYDPSLIDLSEPEAPEWVERLRNSRGEPDCDLVGDPDEFDYVVRLTTWPSLIADRVVYVDASAPLGGDGSSWSTAYQSLHDALNAESFETELVDIRIAQGLYRADRVNGVDTQDPDLTYELPGITVTEGIPTGVMRIAGGFAGRNTKDPDVRDTELYPTVFTGDMLGNDTEQHENYKENTKVMFEPGLTELNGITIEHGRIAIYEGRWVTDCTVRWCYAAGNDLPFIKRERTPVFARDARVVGMSAHDNRSEQYGGAVGLTGFTVIANSRFMRNSAPAGSAISAGDFNANINIFIQNCYFAANRSTAINGGIGGAVWSIKPRSLQTNHCTFAGNESLDGLVAATSSNGSMRSYNSIYNQNYSAYGNDIESDMGLFRVELSNQSRVISNVFSVYNDNADSVEGSIFEFNTESDQPFLAVAGFDGILGTVDDDPSLAAGSEAIGRSVFPPDFPQSGFEEISLFDIADIDGDCDRTEPLPIDMLGNPRAYESVTGEGVDGYAADAGCIEFIPNCKPQQPEPWVYVDPQITDFSEEPIRLYVNAAAGRGGDGLSWQSALQNPGDALAIAASRVGPVEVWVAQGSYVPPVTRSEIRAFRMQNNVTMLGGFEGDETEADQRDWESNETVLTGDVLGNDEINIPETWDDNTKQVVISVGSRGGGILDGFTISDGSPRQTLFGHGTFTALGTYLGGENEAGLVYVGSGDLDIVNCRMGPDATGSLKGRPFVSMDGANSNLQINGSLIRVDRDLAGVSSDFYPITVDRSPVQMNPREGQGIVTILGSTIDVGTSGGLASQSYGSRTILVGCKVISMYEESPLSRPIVLLNDSGALNIIQSNFRGENIGIRSVLPFETPAIEMEQSSAHSSQWRMLVSNNPASPESFGFISNSVFSSNVFIASASSSFGSGIFVGCVFPEGVDQTFLDQQDPTNTTFDFVNNAAAFFAGPLGPDGIPFTGDEDLRLAPGSPAINTGLNEFVDSDFDLDGNERIIAHVVDRGAYEFTDTCTGDVNGDGEVSLGDLNFVLANFGQPLPFGDASGDGVVDLADLNIVLAAFGQLCP